MKYISLTAVLLSGIAFGTELSTIEGELMPSNMDSIRCTMEYDPTVCTYLDISVEGSNLCFARAELGSSASAQNIEIDDSKVVCTSSGLL